MGWCGVSRSAAVSHSGVLQCKHRTHQPFTLTVYQIHSDFSFASQANQALRHDGHFQGMDDEQSRDKLVTKYRQLYDQADLSSQKLEDDYQDQLSVLENHGGNLFLEVLEVGESEQ